MDGLNAEWERFEEKGVSDLGVLIDWCALYQQPRTEEQDRVFGAALKAINQARCSRDALARTRSQHDTTRQTARSSGEPHSYGSRSSRFRV